MSLPIAQRVRATPYARRLARERNLPLSAITGSGPNGRITGDDLTNYRALAAQEPATTQVAALSASPVATPAPATTAAAAAVLTAPAALVTRVEFAALEFLLTQIAGVRPDVAREDICLKAGATALPTLKIEGDGILLLAAPDRRQLLSGLTRASVGAVAALRKDGDGSGPAALALSFIGRTGVRPVAARLVDGVAARLVIGAAEKDGSADCLLSYDPARIADETAEDFLVVFRDLVETPFRLLV